MICRRSTAQAVAVAVSLVLASASIAATARASTLVNPTTSDYVVSLPNGIPAATSTTSGPQLIFSITPAGSIAPSVDSSGNAASPLSIDLNPFVASNGVTYTTSGFDTSQVLVGLKDAGTTPDQQLLGLSFANGVSAGGVIDFQLNKASASTPDPTLTLSSTSPTQDVVIYPPFPQQIQTTSPSTTTSTSTTISSGSSGDTTGAITPTAITPEPVSLVLWSALTVAGILRAHAFRRRSV